MEFTDGLPLCKWWRQQQLEHPEHFEFEILIHTTAIAPSELTLIEEAYQLLLGIPGARYFNQARANGKFVSGPKPMETRLKIAERSLAYWNSPKGQEKKERLRQRNRETKSIEVRQAWNREGFREEQSQKRRGIKRSQEARERYRASKLKTLEYNGRDYIGFDELFRETGISPHLYKKYYMAGVDPEPFIGTPRRRR